MRVVLGIGVRIALGRLDRLPGLLSSPWEYVREVQAISQEHVVDIIGVRNQCAFRSLGPPKSAFAQYSVIPCRAGHKYQCKSCSHSVNDGQLTTSIHRYELLHCVEELAGARERNFIFNPVSVSWGLIYLHVGWNRWPLHWG